MGKIIMALLVCVALGGCMTPREMAKSFLGTSTQELEDGRKEAVVKVFDYGYDACYAKLEKVLSRMVNVSIYARDRSMVAVYYTAGAVVSTGSVASNASTGSVVSVGIFFRAVDDAHTEIAVSSPSRSTRELAADRIFSGMVRPEDEGKSP